MLEKHQHKHAVRDFDGVIEIRSNPVPRYFAWLFYGLVTWGVLFMAYYLLSGWSSEAEFARKMSAHQERSAAPLMAAAPVDAGAQRAAGEKLYAEHCAACHGAKGEGGIGPALNQADYQYGRERMQVIESIAQGRPGGMPAYANQFSATQIEALADFLLQL
ncbi:c-type cytochrome [Geoalkalibacter sp.]|uniref:c-type cytochrome n=1 Tax=Geoalkalibacter sp. TaxID=3041440 RepID=UPI00272E4415|nr:c-type cytochrome [Geoalkalibacter sp.]